MTPSYLTSTYSSAATGTRTPSALHVSRPFVQKVHRIHPILGLIWNASCLLVFCMLLHPSTLASLRFFEAAARLSSFKRAAIELHVTQGAVSQQIKQLERTLGFKLFYRLPRQIELTEDGRQFAVVVAQALAQIEQEARAIMLAGSAAGIRLRAGPSFAVRWLVPRLGEFYARHPNIRLSIMAAYGYFDPARREFDVAIEMMRDKVPVMYSKVLMEEFLIPVCSPEYLLRHPFLKEPNDLVHCTLLHDAHAWTGSDPDAEWHHWLREVGATRAPCAEGQAFNLASMAIEAALTHQGVAMGRFALIRPLLDAGHLVAPLKLCVASPMKYHVVYPQELAGRHGMQAVIAWLYEEARGSLKAIETCMKRLLLVHH